MTKPDYETISNKENRAKKRHRSFRRTASIVSLNRQKKQAKQNEIKKSSSKLSIMHRFNTKSITNPFASENLLTTRYNFKKTKIIKKPKQSTEKLSEYKMNMCMKYVDSLKQMQFDIQQNTNKTNEELNNKLDVEIRILDGILKLLNAITITHDDSVQSHDIITHQHLSQLLNTCKCLFVSHRKIAIYLNDLNKCVKTSVSTSVNNKLYLSNIRIPLSWRWNDYLKATKSSENISSKYAAFALVYAGNMIYDTKLILNIDPTITEISFNETFEFDDVDLTNFEVKIEIYSYEILNAAHTNNLIVQSTRKFARNLVDVVKRALQQNNRHSSSLLNSSFNSQLGQSFNASSTTSSSSSSTTCDAYTSYTASMHRFKLCGRAILNQSDICENIETKNLQIISNDSSNMDHSCGSATLTSNTNSVNSSTTNQSSTTRLPLFDQFCCSLYTK